ncbi:hypothetical protein [Streptomyces sp. NPDC058653]|uniref:hypothetical protein n=1 Tax=Streptomyces sp. NPDC058653 TaxID=3346576 RepID=UPI003663949A
MKIRTFIATASLVASGSLVAFSGSAQAALYTTCVGDGGAVTVSNDLVVPAGKSCTLTGTRVKGTVTVEAGADLVAAGATFNSAVTVEENAYLDLTDTTVKGALTTESAFGTHLEETTVKSVDATEGFLYTVDSTVSGNISSRTGELYVSGSTLGGSVTGENNQYTDVYDSTVKGALTVNGNILGGVFCESEVYGAATYATNADVLQIGGEGLLGNCAGASYFGGNLAFTDNTAEAVLDNAIVRGSLTATGNNPVLVVGDSARIRGKVTGETADAGASSARSAKRAAPQDRGADLAEKAAERAAAARADAHEAGRSSL